MDEFVSLGPEMFLFTPSIHNLDLKANFYPQDFIAKCYLCPNCVFLHSVTFTSNCFWI